MPKARCGRDLRPGRAGILHSLRFHSCAHAWCPLRVSGTTRCVSNALAQRHFRRPIDRTDSLPTRIQFLLMNDLKFAFRQLLKNPGFTTVAVLTLALGIGASTAIYSVVNAVLLNPVPGFESDRLIQIGEQSHGNKDEFRFGGVTTHALEILRTKHEFFSDVVWMESLYLERKSEDFIEGIGGTMVSPNFFTQWNIKPILGRTFSGDEAVRVLASNALDRDTVMVVSYSLWQSRFGGQADVLGKTID